LLAVPLSQFREERPFRHLRQRRLIGRAGPVMAPVTVTGAMTGPARRVGDRLLLLRLARYDGERLEGERHLPLRSEQGGDLPELLRLERLDLALAIDDQLQRHRLDAARAGAWLHLLVQKSTEWEADDAVEDAPRFL